MGDSTEAERTLGVCVHCESVYAIRSWPNGKTRPIGTPRNCPCGECEFRVLE
ncbi:hypothetical protein [Halopiger djelfimassiliensis]|uniref:hypothetical protein n=1 Tax=Halopiger djelfimassiliensis TaxID=1293047 RepID=UPI000AF5FFCE|nr:hypothetical protein [Halopiger djelfimassiliensis]